MKFMYSKKRVLSVFLSVLTVITVLTPAFSAWAGDVIGVYNIQLFMKTAMRYKIRTSRATPTTRR